MENSQPNILFIVLDGLSSDKFFGEKKTSKTPNIDSWIKQGNYFSQAICSAPSTIPSVSSILTSLFPFECVIQDENTFTLNKTIKTLIHYFKEQGYHSYATYQNVIYFLGLDKIFSKVDEYHVTSKLWNGLGEKILNDFSSKSFKEPWIHYLHLYDLHLLSFPIEHQLKEGPKEIHDQSYGKNKYERIVSVMDFWLGKIISKVNLDNTLVIITADHGSETASYDVELEEYNNTNIKKRIHKPGSTFKLAHKVITKFPKSFNPLRKKLSNKYTEKIDSKKYDTMKPELERIENLNISNFRKRLMKNSAWGITHVYDERFRVPLLFFGYGISDSKIISQQVRSVDIFPTILDIAKINFEKKQIQGQSLFPLFKNEKIKELPVLVEGATNAPKFVITNIVGIRTSSYKYFRDKNNNLSKIHLYDLKNDPFEENNIAKNNPLIVKEMEEILIKMQNERGFNYEKSEQILDVDEEKKIEEELRKLGYM